MPTETTPQNSLQEDKSASLHPHSQQKAICFVIGPIGSPGEERQKRASMALRYVIRPAVKRVLGVEPIRADQDERPGSISRQLINYLFNADIVIADLSGHNANVFYEIGIRHAIKKPIIHIIDKATNIPFDNFDYRTIKYDPFDSDTHQTAIDSIASQIEATRKKGFEVVNPVTMAIGEYRLEQSQNPTERIMAEIMQQNAYLANELETIKNQMRQALPGSPLAGHISEVKSIAKSQQATSSVLPLPPLGKIHLHKSGAPNQKIKPLRAVSKKKRHPNMPPS